MSPLAGVRVLDLSRVLAGPWAGQLLADYGADVIKVERPGSGDDTRAWGPPWWGEAAQRMSAYYLCANRGKRSIAIDIASPEGAALVRTLAAEADVLIENYKVGQLARYGLDAPTLRELNPRLVYCSITGYGQSGPDAARAGYDFAIQAAGGLMSITGEAEGTPGTQPQKVGVAVVDLMTGVYATTAILAALQGRERTGQGCHIDTALLDVQVAMLANQASNHLVGGMVPRRMGNAHPNIVPYQVFATADGHIVLAVGNDAQFAKLCEVAHHPEVASDARFATNAARVAHRAELVPVVAAWMVEHETGAWCARLDAAGVPCAPLRSIDQVFQSPQVMARGMLVHRQCGGDGSDARGPAGRVPLVAAPVLLDGERAAARRAPPRLDQDGPALRQALGRHPGWPAASTDGETE
ncbi:CaiB/BaiF CoA transferase family protein [Azohydromonas caseinilytica]|uniref:CoA transferase n=1 Tax=Azohydromonas caseinilytica TaxID=2728836 RepID=A0A848FBF8_9BURK|nr:CaiB/BaiF CoA-transferase family protein [Azohydromonas caseinilytica]NML16638.1 CoA transferase [Azohydromonas caseinilytica]